MTSVELEEVLLTGQDGTRQQPSIQTITVTTLNAVNISYSGAIAAPGGASVVTTGATQTLTNKTLSGCTISGSTTLSGLSDGLLIRSSGVLAATTTPSVTQLTITADDSSDATAPDHILIRGSTNNNKQLAIGFNTTSNYSYIQSIEQSVAFRAICINPLGGQVTVGTTSSALPSNPPTLEIRSSSPSVGTYGGRISVGGTGSGDLHFVAGIYNEAGTKRVIFGAHNVTLTGWADARCQDAANLFINSSSGTTVIGSSATSTGEKLKVHGTFRVTGVATFDSAPVISTITNSGTLTLPTSSDTLVGRATTDTLTNKTLTAPVISTISNTGTITLPTATTTLVGRDTTDTLTNKTINGATIGGTTTLNDLSDGYLTRTAGVLASTTSLSASQLVLTADDAAPLTPPDHIMIRGATNNNLQLLIGYNTTSGYAYLQSINSGTAYTPLTLNGIAGEVLIGATSSILGSGKPTLEVRSNSPTVGNWGGRITAGGTVGDDVQFMCGLYNSLGTKRVLFGGHNGALTSWTDAHTQEDANLFINGTGGTTVIGASAPSTGEKLKVHGTMRSTSTLTTDANLSVGTTSAMGGTLTISRANSTPASTDGFVILNSTDHPLQRLLVGINGGSTYSYIQSRNDTAGMNLAINQQGGNVLVGAAASAKATNQPTLEVVSSSPGSNTYGGRIAVGGSGSGDMFFVAGLYNEAGTKRVIFGAHDNVINGWADARCQDAANLFINASSGRTVIGASVGSYSEKLEVTGAIRATTNVVAMGDFTATGNLKIGNGTQTGEGTLNYTLSRFTINNNGTVYLLNNPINSAGTQQMITAFQKFRITRTAGVFSVTSSTSYGMSAPSIVDEPNLFIAVGGTSFSTLISYNVQAFGATSGGAYVTAHINDPDGSPPSSGSHVVQILVAGVLQTSADFTNGTTISIYLSMTGY